MKKQSLLVSSILALAIYSCQVESVDVLPKNEQLSVNQAKAARMTNGCSAPYSGVNKGWVAGSFSLPTDAQSDKKYVWSHETTPLMTFTVKLNTNYPISVRCVAVHGWYSETYELYDGCYELSSNGGTITLTLTPPTTTLSGNYKRLDFEIIVKGRAGAGKTNTTVPVTINCCSSNGGGC